MKIKKAYQPHSRLSITIDPASGRTHQSFKDECDINNLVDHWLRTGVAQFTPRQAQYADVSSSPDAHAARNLIALAEQEFALLSSEDQKSFGTPLAYLESLVEATEDELGTEPPLGVTVPSDTNNPKSSQKGGKDAPSNNPQVSQQAPVQSNGPSGSSQE